MVEPGFPERIEVAVLWSMIEHRCDVLVLQPRKATAYACYLEFQIAPPEGVHDEAGDVALYDTQRERRLDLAVFGGDGKALADMAVATPHDSTHLAMGEASCTSSVNTAFVGAEDEDHFGWINRRGTIFSGPV